MMVGIYFGGLCFFFGFGVCSVWKFVLNRVLVLGCMRFRS